MTHKLENVFIKVGDATPSKIKNYFELRGVDTSHLKCESTNTEDCYGVLYGVFSLYYAYSRKAKGGIFVIPMDTEGTFIKCGTATSEQIMMYFSSRGIETHSYDLKCTEPNHCYGVFEGKFGLFRVEYVSKFDAEFITIYEDKKPKQSAYYYLMTENGGKPIVKHLSIESARKEAERILLVGASLKSVEILQCVEVWKSEKKVKVSSESLVEGGKGE